MNDKTQTAEKTINYLDKKKKPINELGEQWFIE